MKAHEARGRAPPSRLGARIVEAHLDALAARVERVCLITDTVQREEDRSGRTMDRLDLMFGVGLPRPADAWDWAIAPFWEIGRRRRLTHRVHAYPDWRAARS